MNKNNNIFVKLQIERDQNSGNLTINVHFDKNAPNFWPDKDDISWSPTLEEIDFIEETFQLIPKHKSHVSTRPKQSKTQTVSPPLEKKQEEPIAPSAEAKTEDFETSKPETETEESPPPSDEEPNETKDKVFVQANEETIDEVLKRKSGDIDDALIVEADEKTIIDRVLKQKRKR